MSEMLTPSTRLAWSGRGVRSYPSWGMPALDRRARFALSVHRRHLLLIDAAVPVLVGAVIVAAMLLHGGASARPLPSPLAIAAAATLWARRRVPGWTLAISGALIGVAVSPRPRRRPDRRTRPGGRAVLARAHAAVAPSSCSRPLAAVAAVIARRPSFITGARRCCRRSGMCCWSRSRCWPPRRSAPTAPTSRSARRAARARRAHPRSRRPSGAPSRNGCGSRASCTTSSRTP